MLITGQAKTLKMTVSHSTARKRGDSRTACQPPASEARKDSPPTWGALRGSLKLAKANRAGKNSSTEHTKTRGKPPRAIKRPPRAGPTSLQALEETESIDMA